MTRKIGHPGREHRGLAREFYQNLACFKGGITYQWGKDVLFHKWCFDSTLILIEKLKTESLLDSIQNN